MCNSHCNLVIISVYKEAATESVQSLKAARRKVVEQSMCLTAKLEGFLLAWDHLLKPDPRGGPMESRHPPWKSLGRLPCGMPACPSMGSASIGAALPLQGSACDVGWHVCVSRNQCSLADAGAHAQRLTAERR